MAARWEESRKVAKSLGVPLAETRPPFRFRTRRLLMCAEYAKLVGKFWPFHLGLLEAFYGHHKDISQVAVVDGIAERVGINPEVMEATVESGRFLGVLDQYRWEAAREGVFGVPTFVIEGQLVWGRQTLEEVEEALIQAGVEKKKGGG
jgi:2-hydroxychromene-2-carboxylate isomerase